MGRRSLKSDEKENTERERGPNNLRRKVGEVSGNLKKARGGDVSQKP